MKKAISVLLVCLVTFISFAEDGTKTEKEFSINNIVKGAVGPFTNYCDGYSNPGTSGIGYVSVLTLGTGIVLKDMDEVLEGIVSYDRAETKGTYIGQINMIAASSFNGLNGVVWGYHIAKNKSIADGTLKPLFKIKRHDGLEIPVYPVEPLLDAGKRLFGQCDQRRFPLLPGSHVICATKEITATGPTKVWSAIAISMAENRTKDSNLFIEDAGVFDVQKSKISEKEYFDQLLRKIAKCAVRCGKDNKAKYKEIYVGYQVQNVPKGYVGCALVAAPYVVLAKDAIPSGGTSQLSKLTISEWEKDRKLKALKKD